MPNVAKVLKEEISRIARREAKAAVAPVRKPYVRLRKDVAGLKKTITSLMKASKQLNDRLATIEAARPAVPAEPEGRQWISGKGIRSLRKRLGLSQADFAKLLRVSTQAVYTWESKSGMLKLRGATKAAVFSVRGIGAREARKRLQGMKATPPKATKKTASRRGKARRRRK